MTNNQRVRTADENTYVFYRHEDYAGFFRRALAIGIDLVVLLAIWIGYHAFLDVTGLLHNASFVPWYTVPIGLIGLLYLTVLKRSELSTPGFRLTGVRIVDLRGEPPSIARMTVRAFWWVLGPVNPVIDLLFLTSEKHRQTVRDLIVGTYVILRSAEPIGTGKRTSGRLSFMGNMMLIYPTVRMVSPGDPNAAE